MDVMDTLKAIRLDDAKMWSDSQTSEGLDHPWAFTVLRAFVDVPEEGPAIEASAILAGLGRDPATPEAVKVTAAALNGVVSPEDANHGARALAYEVLLRVSALLGGAMIPAVTPEDLMFGFCNRADDGNDYVPTASITGLQERLPMIAAARLGADVVAL